MTGLRRKLERQQRKVAARAAIQAARAQGCTCKPVVTFGEKENPTEAFAGDSAMGVRHDDWCPLLRVMQERPPGLARTQAVLYDPEERV